MDVARRGDRHVGVEKEQGGLTIFQSRKGYQAEVPGQE